MLTAPFTALIDLDDTLFDHMYSSRCGLLALYNAVPALTRLPFETLVELHSDLIEELHLEVLQGRRTLDEARTERFRRLLERIGAQATHANATHAAHMYRHAYQADRRLVPGAEALLHALRPHARIAIVTNNTVAEQQEKVRTLGIAGLFDELIVSEAVGAAKPDPAIFHAALASVGGSAERACMLGDSWSADIIGAHRTGIRAVWLNRSGRACPDPTLAAEIRALEPVHSVMSILLDQHVSHDTA